MRKQVTLAFVLALVATTAGANQLVMSIHSVTAKDYKRQRLPNGTYKRERYAIANGGWLDGTARDNSMEKIPFAEIAGVLAEHLGRQNYFLARDSKSADLLLVVHWGRTIAFDDTSYEIAINDAGNALAHLRGIGNGLSGSRGALFGESESSASETNNTPMVKGTELPDIERFESEMLKVLIANRERDKVNEHNALVLGYIDDVNKNDGIRRWAGGGDAFEELIRDIEESRYYLTITAYDFDEMVRRNKKNVRWVTRVSIRAPGNAFNKEFPVMLANASRYFGRDTGKLLRGDRAMVEIGDASVVGIAAEPGKD